jgi:vitamin B12 transporter
MQLKKSASLCGAWTTVPCLLAAGITGFSSSRGEAEERELDPLVIAATRMETAPSRIGGAVSVLDLESLKERQIADLQTALNELPGVIALSTGGQRGALGSLFIRGTTTTDSQVMVDGVRLSDSTSPMGNFLGFATLDGIGRAEVLRGPQSALYGGEAVGGVLALTTVRGTGAASGSLLAEAGSFGSSRAVLSFQGEVERLSYAISSGFEDTRNDAPQNDFRLWSEALRLDYAASDALTVGLTFRGVDSHYEDRGVSVDDVTASLVTLFAEMRHTAAWSSKVIAGFYREEYESEAPWGNYGTDLDRLSLSWDNEVAVGDEHRFAFGGFVENVDYRNTIGTQENRDRYGVHGGWQWELTEQLTTYLGARWEDYAAYGDEFTYRGSVAYQLPRGGTILRTSYGKAFRTPNYLELFGTSYGAGNPDLLAEESRGWDLGLEQPFAGTHRVSVAYFRNHIENRIQAFPPPPVNRPGTTRTSGVETALAGTFCDGLWNYRASYTYLGSTLADLPRHTADASLTLRPADRWLVGAGASYIDDRSYGGGPLDEYLLVRLHASYQWTENLQVHARVENLLDENYQLSDFGKAIDGRGLGCFAGLTWNW